MLTKKQMQGYRSASWRALRRQIFEREGWRCMTCGKICEEADLQVHHLYYLMDKMPWEYPPEALTSICKGCHAKEHGHIMPTSGWEYVGYNDLGDFANNLTSTEIASEYEKERRRFAGRQSRFIQSYKWKVNATKNGGRGHFLRQDPFNFKIWEHTGVCTIEVEYLQRNAYPRNDRHWITLPRGKQRFNSVTDAKAHIFRMLENGELSRYVIKHYPQRSYNYDDDCQEYPHS